MDIQRAIDTFNYLVLCGSCTTGPCKDCDRKNAKDTAIQGLRELQQYRQIGTVDELKNKIAELERWHTDRTNEKIRNPFANTSTLICHNCDHKDEYIEELESWIEEYEKIGTVDECRAAMEKQTPKEPIDDKYRHKCCPICGWLVCYDEGWGDKYVPHCENCGQALKWGD